MNAATQKTQSTQLEAGAGGNFTANASDLLFNYLGHTLVEDAGDTPPDYYAPEAWEGEATKAALEQLADCLHTDAASLRGEFLRRL